MAVSFVGVVVAALAIGLACALWAWIQLRRGCAGGSGCGGDGQCGACTRRSAPDSSDDRADG